jgi:tricorn protease
MKDGLFMSAYLQSPDLFENHIYIHTDDDIWKVDLYEEVAHRLTSSKGASFNPKVSPDGHRLAYSSLSDGQNDVYLMPSTGGIPKRLTHFGDTSLVGWKDNKHVIITTADFSFHPAASNAYLVDVETLESKLINVGPTRYINYGPNKEVLLCRNMGDPARWKRYRGGTVGRVWIDTAGNGNFKEILKELPSSITTPQFIGKRIYFISDHEGHGNIYSCNFSGKNIQRHTHHEDYYVRKFSHHDGTIVYQAGALIFLLDLQANEVELIDITVPVNGTHANPRFESPYKNLQDFSVSPEGDEILTLTRGNIFCMPPWRGAPTSIGNKHGLRYKRPDYVTNPKDQQEIITVVMDENTEEEIVLFNRENGESRKLKLNFELGKTFDFEINPVHYSMALINNRAEIWYIDIKTGRGTLIEKNPNIEMQTVNWSPCGTWLAYKGAVDKSKKGLMVWNLKTKKSQSLITPVLDDGHPVFHPGGEYLFFIGHREFHPTPSAIHFDLSFPFAACPYVVSLKKGTPNLFERYLDYENDKDENEDGDESKEKSKSAKKSSKVTKKKTKKKDDKKKELPKPIEIDFEDIDNRIMPLPLPLNTYRDLMVTKDHLFYVRGEVSAYNPLKVRMSEETLDLCSYEFKSGNSTTMQKDITGWSLSKNGKYLLLESGDELRLFPSDVKPTSGEEFNKKDGWIDLSRIKFRVHPREEWRQMFKEAWILQRENFWTPDMSKIDWVGVYEKYLPLLDRVNSRREFSDLMWEMQGELGTSHCYEFGGDYTRVDVSNLNAKLGAEFKWDSKEKAMKVVQIFRGDSWITGYGSPLTATSVELQEGDLIYEIDGQTFDNPNSMYEFLDGKILRKVNLAVKRKGKKDIEDVVVQSISSNELPAYRDWVEKNKAYVHKKSQGKLGYVHIPDMGFFGFAEFFRNYLSEFRKEGLIVDVRYNGGGMVSQLILRYLSQRIIGFDETRHFGHEPYPMYAVPGSITCLTNEYAGSDGDIFSHSFKLMGLGKLVGKRTWGGVIGMWPRYELNDGTWTSQPEFSFWFEDVGWDVENYGTDPDIEIDIKPQEWAKGLDPQLDKAISVAIADLKKNPPLRFNKEKGQN